MIVAKSAATAFEEHEAVNARKVLYDLTCAGVLDHGSRWNRYLHVVSIAAIASRTAAAPAVLCTEGTYDLEMCKRP